MTTVNNSAPLQLIRFKDNKFQIPQQTQQFLRQFKNPIGIISIVGKYRTGKSLFLNKVLLRHGSFKVSPTINSCTKGLWMCRQTIKSENNEEVEVLVIDTQGFGATQQTDAYNNKILIFAMLLSSYFIYNSVGSIDENSLNSLNVIANIARQIQKNNSKDQKIEQEFPSFLWLVRDFTLNLVDRNGYPIQSREYLEQALQNQKGTSDAIENKNKIRRMIKHFFKDRDCFTMVRPVDTEQKLQNLLALPDHDFRSEFLEQAVILRNKILKKVKSKKIRGKTLDGEMLLELASSYVQVVNQGSLPNFQVSYKQIIRYQLNKAIQQFMASCRDQIKQFGLKMKSKQQIIKKQELLLAQLQQKFKQGTFQGDQLKMVVQKAQKQIKEYMISFQKQNHLKSINHCNSVWQSLFEEDKQFQKEKQIEDYFQKLERQFLKEMEINQNPISKDHCKTIVLIQKCRIMQAFIQKYSEITNIETSQKSLKIQQISSQNAIQANKIQSLQSELYELNREHIKINSKYQELEKIKQMEVGYLKQKQIGNNADISQLSSKNQELCRELEALRGFLAQHQGKHDELGRVYRQLSEQKRLVDRQLDIVRNSLQSKAQQIVDLKQQISELSALLGAAKQRQISIVSRAQADNEVRNGQYQQLHKHSLKLNEHIVQLSKKQAQISQQLKSSNISIQRERSIYENMFQTFKESLKLEALSRQQLIETNKNLSSALKHMEKRAEQAEEKEKQLKEFKKCVKNSSCLQCQHCTKFFVASIFIPHLNVCLLGPQALKNLNVQSTQPAKKLDIKIRQTLVKQQNGKPYTEYVIQFRRGEDIWSINRKYKFFCDLNSLLRAALPGVQLSDVSYIVNPQQTNKKSLVIQERRKALEKYLNDLSANPLVAASAIWMEFIQEPQSAENSSATTSPLKENRRLSNSEQTPQQFFKIWNERKMRGKQSSMTKKYRPGCN